MAGTSWKTFAPFTKVRAKDLNSNFDWFEGSFVPHTGKDTTNAAYDLGSSTYKFKDAHFGTSVYLGGKELASVVDGSATVYDSINFQIYIGTNGVSGANTNTAGTPGHIASGTISTPDIRDYASILSSMQFSSDDPLQKSYPFTTTLIHTLATLSINVTTNNSILVSGQASFEFDSDNGDIFFWLDQDGSDTYFQKVGVSRSVVGQVSQRFAGSPGTSTIRLYYYLLAGTVLTIPSYALSAVQFKK